MRDAEKRQWRLQDLSLKQLTAPEERGGGDYRTLPLGMGDWNLSCLPRHLLLAVSLKIKVMCSLPCFSSDVD